MIDFFKTQMDYIQFFYGLAFITLASVCFIMVKGKESRLPWVWLGLFGLTHGIYEWLDMAEDFFGDGRLIRIVGLLLGVVSFIFLTEFGRAGTARLQGKGPGRWIFAPLLVLAGLGAFGGWNGLNASCRFTLGLVGGLWASYVLFLAARRVEKPEGRWLSAGGATLGLYGITAGLVGPYAPFFPASLLNGEVFLNVFGFPVQLVRGILAIATAVSVWGYSQMPSIETDAQVTRPNRPKNTFFPVALLLCIIAAGWVLTQFAGNHVSLLDSIGHIRAYRLFAIFTTLVFCGLTFLLFGALHFARESAAKISASERRYRSLVEGSPDGIILFNDRGRCLTINSAGLSLIGCTENDAIGKGLTGLLAGGQRQNLDEDIRQVLRGTMISFETEMVRSDGKRMTWSVILNPVYDFDGSIRRFMGIVVDITYRRHAEATLKESEKNFRELSQQFHTLLDAIPDMLLLLSPDLRVLWANRYAAFRLGMETSAMKGKYCYELWHRRYMQCEDCHVRRTFQTGEAEISQRTTANGGLFESRSFPIKDETGSVSNVIQIISDVTEKVTLRAEAMRASHLASLGELAAGVAHEINNPINGIINYAQILVNNLERERKEGEIAGRIIKEGNRVAGIVRSLLSFARERKEGKAPVSVTKILHEAITLTEAQIRKDGTNLKIHLPPDLPEIIASQQQIEQVFLNLISNARYALNKKYPGMHEDKHLEISGEKIVSDGSSYVRVTFHDKGTGMPGEILGKVMNPFFSTKPSGEGTGLGLSISHGIVRDHGGRILIESLEGRFTTVMVDLPLKETDGR